MRVRVPSFVLMAAAAVLLAGCGVRGSLEAPPEAKADASAQPVKPGEPPPHRPFVLDGLLR